MKFREIDDIKIEKYDGYVYDLETEKYNHYAANDFIIHNCCRLRETITDMTMVKNPESLRFCGFQNVTINLPQAAYRGKGDFNKTVDEIIWAMKIAMKAHLQKKKFIQSLMDDENKPLWQVGKPSEDGKPYIDLEKSTYIIGMLGLNECVQRIMGKQLHESDDALNMGIKIVAHMYSECKEFAKEYKLKVVLEESPAESAAARLAKIDLNKFPEAKKYIKGNKDNGDVYYTNSTHFTADADIDILDRIDKQSKFNQLIEAGAITHVFLGEQRPTKEAVFNLVEKTWRNTQSAQLTLSPELIICHSCGRISRGFSTDEE